MSDDLFAAAGSLRDRYEALDWSATSFGPLESWSETLRSTVRMILSTRFACTLLWGPDYAMLYNEAYVPMIGAKHPAAIGSPASEVFHEAWPIIGPLMEHVSAAREPTWTRDELVPLERHEFLEECYFTFSYSPVANDRGEVEGVLDIAAETTLEVIARRRLELLARLRTALAEAVLAPEAGELTPQHVQDVLVARAVGLLGEYAADFPRVTVLDAAIVAAADPAGPGVDLAMASTADGGTLARMWLPRPTTGADRVVLEVALSPALPPDDDYTSYLRLVSTSIGQALQAAWVVTAERAAARSEREFSESLQRSLLGSPVQPDHIEVAVRYVPAADSDQIGGDWYDAFLSRDGALTLVIGDVAGHDRSAAVAMGQARNLLRGISFALDRPPGATMEAFDDAIGSLEDGTMLTAVLARLEQDPELAGTGHRRLRWSTAGHPPPLLVDPYGEARFLEDGHHPMLGFVPGHPRDDSAVDIDAGSTLVLYTDGLVERRGVNLDDSLTELRRSAEAAHHLGVEALADHLLGHAGPARDDDVALIVVRFGPEDGFDGSSPHRA